MSAINFRSMLSIFYLYGLTTACSSHLGTRQEHSNQCKATDCEVENYEHLLQRMGAIESELKNGNSYKALNELEKIKSQAYYHGRFKSLYRIALDTCLKTTNEMSMQQNSCSIVRERVRFIKTVSPDKMNSLAQAISNCNIDVSNNAVSFDFELKGKDIELTKTEFAASNLYEASIEIRNKYNSNPWEKLLQIDLEVLSSYQFHLGESKLSKEMPNDKVRLFIPVKIEQSGSKTSYCPQYKKVLHNKGITSFSQKQNCFDYPEWSDHFSKIWRDSTGPHKWTDGTYLTEISLTSEARRHVTDIPFTKGYQKLLSLDIKYSSGIIKKEELTVDYPGEKIPRNLMARLAYTQMFSIEVGSPGDVGVIIKAVSQNGIAMTLYQSGFWGYEIRLDIPNEMVKDFESVSLSIPIQSIRDHFHNQMSMN